MKREIPYSQQVQDARERKRFREIARRANERPPIDLGLMALRAYALVWLVAIVSGIVLAIVW